MPQHTAFSWFYLGAVLIAVIAGASGAIRTSCRPPRCSGACCCGWAWPRPGWGTLCGTTAPPGRCRNAGHYEQHARASRVTGESGNLAGEAALAELYRRGAGDFASLYVHKRWVLGHTAKSGGSGA